MELLAHKSAQTHADRMGLLSSGKLRKQDFRLKESTLHTLSEVLCDGFDLIFDFTLILDLDDIHNFTYYETNY